MLNTIRLFLLLPFAILPSTLANANELTPEDYVVTTESGNLIVDGQDGTPFESGDLLIVTQVGDSLLDVRIPNTDQAGQIEKTKVVLLTKAGQLLDRLVREQPKNGKLLRNRGLAFDSRKEFDLAIEDFTKAIQIDEADYAAYTYRGMVLRKLGKLDEALEDLDQAVQFNTDAFTAYFQRALIHESRKDWWKAIVDHGHVVRLKPKAYWAYRNRGNIHRIARNFTSALRDLDTAIELKPTAKSYQYRGLTHRARFYDKAIADFTEAIKLDPGNSVYHFERAYDLYNRKDYDGAISDYTESIRLDPNSTNAYNNRAQCWEMKGDPEKAIDDFSKGLEIDPKYSLLYMNRARVYESMERTEDAVADYEQAKITSPTNTGPYERLIEIWTKAQDWDKVIESYNQLIEIQPQATTWLLRRAATWKQLGKIDNAIRDYDRLIELDDVTIRFKLERAEMVVESLLSNAEFEKAFQFCENTLNENSNFSIVAATLNMKARVLLTMEGKLFDPESAVLAATRACAKDRWFDYNYIVTLAAANTACGRFDDARVWIEMALEKAQADDVPRLKSYLDLIDAKKTINPWAPLEQQK